MNTKSSGRANMEIHEVSSSVGSVVEAPRAAAPTGVVLRSVLGAGSGRSPTAVKTERLAIDGEIDWPAVCAVAHRMRIAPIVYQGLRSAALAVPRDVMDWFRVQHYDTVARNLISLNTLRAVLDLLTNSGIPAVVFKGPALAELGHGMARSWNDLDILVESTFFARAESILTQVGYQRLPDAPHPNHRRYATGSTVSPSVLEVHFDISDPLRAYRPDLAAIWGRAAEGTVLGVPARVPELMDHFLLTIMQLPHHHWSVRVLLDIREVIARHEQALDWSELYRRAEAWGMLALTRSALSVLSTEFDVSLPPSVAARARPMGYYDRLRREIATQAIEEQLEHPFRPRVMWLAPFIVSDRPSHVPRILLRRLLAGDDMTEDGRVGRAVRRNVKTLIALPEVVRAVLASVPGSREER
jgi:hypothetical protein